MNDKPRSVRSILRKAEKALGDPMAKEGLAAEGVFVGEAEEVSAADLLRELNEGPDSDAGPSIDVTVYFDDTPVDDRGAIEDPLSEFVEDQGIGTWVGSGQVTEGGRRFFDVTFSVHDLALAIPLVIKKLRELGAGPSTEVAASDGSVYNLS